MTVHEPQFSSEAKRLLYCVGDQLRTIWCALQSEAAADENSLEAIAATLLLAIDNLNDAALALEPNALHPQGEGK